MNVFICTLGVCGNLKSLWYLIDLCTLQRSFVVCWSSWYLVLDVELHLLGCVAGMEYQGGLWEPNDSLVFFRPAAR